MGHDGSIQRPVGLGGARLALCREIHRHPCDQPRGIVGVGTHGCDHSRDIDGVVLGVPAVEIRHHGNGGIGDLRFARELGFGHVGHADHIVASRAIGLRFGIGRELRAFDADIGAAFHRGHILVLRGLNQPCLQQRPDRMRHGHMRHAARREEGAFAPVRAVNELVGEHQKARIKLRFE